MRAKLGITIWNVLHLRCRVWLAKGLCTGLFCGVASLEPSRILVRLMADDDRITLIIEGLPEDDGQVRFGAFMNQLQHLSGTITKLDREASDGKLATFIGLLSFPTKARCGLSG